MRALKRWIPFFTDTTSLCASRLASRAGLARVGLFTLATLGLGSCGDPDFAQSLVDASPNTLAKNHDRLTATLDWGPCPPGFGSACAKLSVPRDWLDLQSPSLQLMISRREATGPSKGQIWLVDGGPGGNGSSLLDSIEQKNPGLLDNYEVLTLSHRGTLHSDLLECDAQDPKSPGSVAVLGSEVQACVAQLQERHGDDLQSFRLTHAARDLSHAIRRTRVPGQPVFVYGFSYGTLLAQRFTQLAPLQVNGLILDGVLPSRAISYFDFDLQFDSVARSLSTICGQDEFCSAKWSKDPWGQINALMQRLENGHCPELGLKGEEISRWAAPLLIDRQERLDLLALLHRMQRCEPEDVQAFKHYQKARQDKLAQENKDADPKSFSALLFYNIIFSEILDSQGQAHPTASALKAKCDSATFCPGFSTGTRELFDHWPQYAPDRFYRTLATFHTPVLAMSGALDPQTPIGQASKIRSQLSGPAQTFVEFPYAPHWVLTNTPTTEPGQMSCAGQIMRSFLDNPSQEVDLDCMAKLEAPQFDQDEDYSRKFFGTQSAWDNDPTQRLEGPATSDARVLPTTNYQPPAIPRGARL